MVKDAKPAGTKLRAPEGTCSVGGVDGAEMKVGKDGTVVIADPDLAASLVQNHGFTVAE